MSTVVINMLRTTDGSVEVEVADIASKQSLEGVRDDLRGIGDEIEEISSKTNSLTVVGVDFVAEPSRSYYLTESINVELPSTVNLDVGAIVKFTKTTSATPTITTGDVNIVSGDKVDTDVLYDAQAELTFIFNGTVWEL